MTTNEQVHEGIAVEFYFDRESERKIRAFREEMYQQGITPMLGALNDRPHISLAVFGHAQPERLLQLTESLARNLKPFPFQLNAVGVFPTPDNVLFLIPAASKELLTIHADFHQQLEEEKLRSSHYYLPGNWVPHCTIESDLSNPQFNRAITLSKSLFTPINGTITELGVVAFQPIKYLGDFILHP